MAGRSFFVICPISHKVSSGCITELALSVSTHAKDYIRNNTALEFWDDWWKGEGHQFAKLRSMAKSLHTQWCCSITQANKNNTYVGKYSAILNGTFQKIPSFQRGYFLTSLSISAVNQNEPAGLKQLIQHLCLCIYNILISFTFATCT